MKIGMLTGLWFVAERATLIHSLRRTAALGFRYVDIHGTFHGGPAILKPEERLAVKSEMKVLGLVPRNYVLHAPHNVPSANEIEIEENFACLREGIDMALTWGVNQLMLNAGQWAYGMTRRAAWEKSVRFPAEGVRLCCAARGFHRPGTGFTRTKDYLDELRRMEIDRRVKRSSASSWASPATGSAIPRIG
jgi:hypothetical protein